MPDLYRQVVDNEGNTSFERIEQVPDEIIYTDERYRKVVDESVGRRNKVKELAEQLAEAQAKSAKVDTPAEKPAPVTPAPVQEPVKVLSIDEIYSEIQNRQKQELAQQSQAEAELFALATEHGLDASYMPILKEARNPKIVAEELGRKKLSFATGQVNQTPTNDPNALFTKINKELGLK